MEKEIFTAEQARELKERRAYEVIKKAVIEGEDSCYIWGLPLDMYQELLANGYFVRDIDTVEGKHLYKIEW